MTPDFEDAVLDVIRAIPHGEVATYGEVAAAAGFPRAARAVGTLLRTTGTECPWWRVVGWDGQLRAPDSSLQGRLLVGEGVTVRRGKAILGA